MSKVRVFYYVCEGSDGDRRRIGYEDNKSDAFFTAKMFIEQGKQNVSIVECTEQDIEISELSEHLFNNKALSDEENREYENLSLAQARCKYLGSSFDKASFKKLHSLNKKLSNNE